MTEAGEFQAPTPKHGFFQKMIELFTRRNETSKAKSAEKFAKDALINLTTQENQEPAARFYAGGPAQIDLSIIPAGTVLRIETIRPDDLDAIRQGDDESQVDVYKSFFWFVTGTSGEIYKVQPVIDGKKLNSPAATGILPRESDGGYYSLLKFEPNVNVFKPGETLKLLYPDDREDNNPRLHPDLGEYLTQYLHETYEVVEVDIMESGSYGQIDGGGDKADVVDVVAVQKGSNPAQVLSPA